MASTHIPVKSKRPTKSGNFHNREIKQVSKSWIALSENPISSARQRLDKFWEGVHAHFNKAMDTFRLQHPRIIASDFWSMRSLQSKWTEINHDSNKFSSCFSTILALNKSKATYDQQIEKAMKLFKQTHKSGEDFKLMSSWDHLKECPKWKDSGRIHDKSAHKRKRVSRASSSSLVPHNDGTIALDDGPQDDTIGSHVMERMVGNKKAKQIAPLEHRAQRGKENLADATERVVEAMTRKALVVEDANQTRLFLTNIEGLDSVAQSFLIWKRLLADMKLIEEFAAFQNSRIGLGFGNEIAPYLDDSHLGRDYSKNEAEADTGNDYASHDVRCVTPPMSTPQANGAHLHATDIYRNLL